MLNINKKLSEQGFSLLELMVAAAILAMAIFGIFHAYSVGFMGMADARDRTVATNYAREAMEDIKNMDFESISSTSLEQIGTTKYKREISVEDNIEGSPNLKKVTTRVFWHKRDGESLNIETSMLINQMEFFPDVPSRLLLYVTPYNIIFPYNDFANLIAVVKDEKGNTVTDWDEDITFTIESINPSDDISGYLENDIGETGNIMTINPINGIATIMLYSGEASTLDADEIGNINVSAKTSSAETGELSDSVDVKVTLGAVKIGLISKQDSIETNTIKIDSNTEIIATLVDTKSYKVSEGEAEIIFNVSGVGSLSDPLTRITENQQTSITLTASNTPGVATVTASANNLLPGTIDVYVTGPPQSIYVEVNPNHIYMDQTADVIVTLKDINGNTVDAEEDVNIELSLTGDSVGQGRFDNLPTSMVLISIGNSSGSSIFYPTATGNATVQAVDSGNELTTGFAAITIASALEAKYIEVDTSTSGIKAGGDSSSTITAEIKSLDGITVSSYEDEIIFTTNKGSFSPTDPNKINISTIEEGVYYQNGVAKVELYSNLGDSPGDATITVTSDDLTPGSTVVVFYVEADHIELTSNDDTINAMGKVPSDECEITASIKDNMDNVVDDYVGTVIFTITEGSNYARFAPDNTTATKSVEEGTGIVKIDLRGRCEPEGSAQDVEIYATSYYGDNPIYSLNYLPITVSIVTNRTIEIDNGNINLSSNKKEVEFDINLSGGNLKVYNILVNYATQKLYDVEINNISVYSGSSNDGDITDITDTVIPISNNPNHIHLIFDGRIDNKEIQITFNAQPECASVGPFIVSTLNK